MNVHIVEYGVPYEGNDTLGAFSTLENAINFAKKIIEKQYQNLKIKPRISDDGKSITWDNGNEYIDIFCLEVDRDYDERT